MKKVILVLIMLGLTVATASSVVATTITGTITSPTSMTSTGSWLSGSTLTFWVTDPAQNNDPTFGDYWFYKYTFTPIDSPTIPGGGISHVTIEVSTAFTSDNIFGASFGENDYELGIGGIDEKTLVSIGGSMDNALKVEGNGESEPFTFWFYSNIGPMYGDFLAKDGVNTDAYNSAIGVTPRPDLVWGSYVDLTGQGWIVVPDTEGAPPPIPEPATMLLLGSGLIGLAGVARRRFKK